MFAPKTAHPHAEYLHWLLVGLLAALVALAWAGSAGGVASVDKVEEATIQSPVRGIFSVEEYPGGPPYVTVGSHVEPSTIVGRVEPLCGSPRAYPWFVKAGVRGTVVEVLVTDGEVVESGQPLYRVVVDRKSPDS